MNLALVADEHLRVCPLCQVALQRRRRTVVALQRRHALHEHLVLHVGAHRGMCSSHCSREPMGNLVVVAFCLQAAELKRGAALPQQRHNGGAGLGGSCGRPAGRLQRSLVCTATRAPHSLPMQPSRSLQMLVLAGSSATDVGGIVSKPTSTLFEIFGCSVWLPKACL